MYVDAPDVVNALCDGPYEDEIVGEPVDMTLTDGTLVSIYPDGFMFAEWNGFEVIGAYGEIDIKYSKKVLSKQAGGCIADRRMLQQVRDLLHSPVVDLLLADASNGVLGIFLTTTKTSMPFQGYFNTKYLAMVRDILDSPMLNEFLTLSEQTPDN